MREGREKGYEDALQGRDESGFRDGLRQGLQWGELLGEIKYNLAFYDNTI